MMSINADAHFTSMATWCVCSRRMDSNAELPRSGGAAHSCHTLRDDQRRDHSCSIQRRLAARSRIDRAWDPIPLRQQLCAPAGTPICMPRSDTRDSTTPGAGECQAALLTQAALRFTADSDARERDPSVSKRCLFCLMLRHSVFAFVAVLTH